MLNVKARILAAVCIHLLLVIFRFHFKTAPFDAVKHIFIGGTAR